MLNLRVLLSHFFFYFSPLIIAQIPKIGIRAPGSMFGISSTKFDMVKFDGSGNFGLWQRRIKDLLVQQGMVKVLYGKQLDGMNNMDWKDLKAKTAAMIKLCLVDDVMYHVMDEESLTTIWLKLESRYMSK